MESCLEDSRETHASQEIETSWVGTLLPFGLSLGLPLLAGCLLLACLTALLASYTTIQTSDILFAIPQGLRDSADLLILIFICSGVIEILKSTDVIDAGVGTLLKKYGGSPHILSCTLFTLIAFGAATIGIGDDFIPLIPVILAFGYQLGYDRFFSICLLFLSTVIGYMASITNPFNVYIAQKMANIPINSGWPLRSVFFASSLLLVLAFLFAHNARTRKKVDPATEIKSNYSLNRAQLATFIVIGLTYASLIFGMMVFDWSFHHFSLGYLVIGLATIWIHKMPYHTVKNSFLRGVMGVADTTWIIGLTRGLQLILDQGMLLESAVQSLGTFLEMQSSFLAVQGMFFLQLAIGMISPSSTGQAMMTIPLFSPLVDQLEIPRQLCVLTFQTGSSLSDLINPASSSLIIALRLSGITFRDWLRFIFPLFGLLIILVMSFLSLALIIN